jgi:hypothetical protein
MPKHSRHAPLTLAAARAHFRANWMIPPYDADVVSVAWAQYLNALRRNGNITMRQFQTWDLPVGFGRPRKVARRPMRKNPSACGCRANPSKARRPKAHEFVVQPLGDYYVVNYTRLLPSGRRWTDVVFRGNSEGIADAAAGALAGIAASSVSAKTLPPDDRFAARPHDGRRGGWKVLDTGSGRVLAEDLTEGEANELAGALWNVINGIARSNASKIRPNGTTKKTTRAPSKARRAKAATARKRR